jgi:hypothetical protein
MKNFSQEVLLKEKLIKVLQDILGDDIETEEKEYYHFTWS